MTSSIFFQKAFLNHQGKTWTKEMAPGADCCLPGGRKQKIQSPVVPCGCGCGLAGKEPRASFPAVVLEGL